MAKTRKYLNKRRKTMRRNRGGGCGCKNKAWLR